MKLSIIDYTGRGTEDPQYYAARLLAFTKATRLDMTPALMDAVNDWPQDKLEEELRYMAGTIPSSWEFVDVTFLIQGVSRAAAQQITRTRTASFAMQSQRVVDMSAVEFVNPFPGYDIDNRRTFNDICDRALSGYQTLVNAGAAKQDARGVLPAACECNLVAKYNLRALVDLIRARASLRTQGEYAELVVKMREAVFEIWPWSRPFFESPNDKAIQLLEEAARGIGIETGTGPGWQIAKAIDLLRK